MEEENWILKDPFNFEQHKKDEEASLFDLDFGIWIDELKCSWGELVS
jgi:hypothetical protein